MKMSATEARAEFDKIISKITDLDQIAKLELVREFLCNPEFRKALEDESARAAGL
jgi:hypothetical protein